MMCTIRFACLGLLSVVAAIGSALNASAWAQSRLPSMPGRAEFEAQSRALQGAVKRAQVRAVWAPDGSALYYETDGKRWKLDLATNRQAEWTGDFPAEPQRNTGPNPNAGRRPPERGRQFTEAFSPDRTRKVYTHDRNAWISDADGKNATPLTQDGSAQSRVKYASACWVYGEELGQRDAMGWSPDGKRVWFYRFDESKCPDYYLAYNVTRVQNTLDVEPYNKAGAPNPEVDVLVCDVATKTITKVDVRDGRPFDHGLGHYVYGIRFSPDSKELWFHRTNRRQNVMQWCAADVTTGKVRVIVEETNPNGWTENSPTRVLFDEHEGIEGAPKWKGKFLWVTERTGFANFAIASLDGKEFRMLTTHPFEVGRVVRLDLKGNRLYYLARSGRTPHLMQLHVVDLDGRNDRRLTDPSLSHTVQISPNGKYILDTAEAVDSPPKIRLLGADGREIVTLAESDIEEFRRRGFHTVERVVFKSADGKFDLFGYLHKPMGFDPNKRYPLLIDVYGGPESGGGAERFLTPDSKTGYGFLVAEVDGRVTNGRGRAFKDAAYLKLGQVEIDDQAAFVRELAKRPYVDAGRVGISGTSYGGYASAMCILRYPDLFHVAVASSSVTDWRNYDTIYTERYMWIPQENEEGYQKGSCLTYANNLRGRLLLYYGTADNNVHPANTYQLVSALQRAGKTHDLQVGPDQGHTGVNFNRMMEYFVQYLVVTPGK